MASASFGACLLVIFTVIEHSSSLLHQKTLLWTQTSITTKRTEIMGLSGDPKVWVDGGEVPFISRTGPTDPTISAVSKRVALGFRYKTRDLLFTDRGLKEVYKIKVREGTGTISYQVPVERVYHGTSSICNGLAVDWLSGTVYWTDGLYNWISMSSLDNHRVYKHIVQTGLDGPTGIAVDPIYSGKMYWGEITGVAKIEMADLDGSNRQVFTSDNVRYPMGVTVDYQDKRLYWTDDDLDSVESADLLTGANRRSFGLNDPDSYRNYIFGIAVYQDYIFVADQFALDIKVYNKSTEQLITSHGVGMNQPFDVIMYDSSLQEDIYTECTRLNCSDMCVSTGNGGGKCICSQNSELSSDGRTCIKDTSFSKPRYIYTVGKELCTTPIAYPDLKDEAKHVDCFLGNLAHAEALAIHVDAELLFYSDTEEGTIGRVYLGDNKNNVTHISVQRGRVRGLAIDWINNLLYWTDEEHNHIMTSHLDGNFPHILMEGIVSPRSIEVDPSTGKMFFSTPTGIYSARMDGSDLSEMWSDSASDCDGMTLDRRTNRLYWVDKNLPGIRSMFKNGTDPYIDFQSSDPNTNFRDLTTYQDYMVWSNGTNAVMFAKTTRNVTSGRRYPELLKAVQHFASDVSHDIVTYDKYAQPPATSGVCDDDNGGCSHICVPRSATEATCKCSIGFTLSDDGSTCTSELKQIEKLMFIDPYHKQMYELDMEKLNPKPQGISLQKSVYPDQFTYDSVGQDLFWVDTASSAIKSQPLNYHNKERVVQLLPSGSSIGAMDIHLASRNLFYSDGKSNTIYQVSLENLRTMSSFESGKLFEHALAVDNVNDLVIWAESGAGETTSIFTKPVISSTPNTKQLIHTMQLYVLGISVDREGRYIYYWTRYEVGRIPLFGTPVTSDGDSMIGRKEFDVEFTSVAVYDNKIYYSQKGKNALYRIDLDTRVVETFTDELFSKITQVKAFRRVSERKTVSSRDPNSGNSQAGRPDNGGKVGMASGSTEESQGALSGINIAIIAGASAGVLLILGMVLTIVCVCAGKRKKKLPPSSANTGAHDNPTYMTTGQTARVPQPPGAAGDRAAQLPEGVYDELPPYKEGAEGTDPTYLEPRDVEEHAKALGLSADSGPEINEADNAELVNNMADSSEVVLQVDETSQGTVAFKKGNENV